MMAESIAFGVIAMEWCSRSILLEVGGERLDGVPVAGGGVLLGLWGVEARMSAAEQLLMPGMPAPTVPDNEEDKRYTLPWTLDWCRRTAGVEAFDLDVAADDEAHVCERYYTVRENGLTQPWTGRVWCNPPYSDIGPWVRRAWQVVRATAVGVGWPVEVIAMLLPANRTEQPWWQEGVEPFRDGRQDRGLAWSLTTHHLPGRQSFGHPGNPLGVGVGSPEFGCVLLVWRPR